MADRFEVHPHHLLRAVLDDVIVVDVLRRLEVEADQLKATLAECWLAAADVIDLEEVEAVGIDGATLLGALNSADGARVEWGGRRLSPPARDVLVRALGICVAMRHARTTSGHVLLALMDSRSAIVAQTFAAHGLRAKDVRPLLAQWGRRAP